MPSFLNLYKSLLLRRISLFCKKLKGCLENLVVWELQLEEALKLERKLSQVLIEGPVLKDIEKTYNLMRIDDLQKLIPDIDWLRLIQIHFPGVSIKPNEQIIVTLPEVIAKIIAIISQQLKSDDGKLILVNMLYYRRMLEASSHLNLGVIEFRNDLFNTMTQSFSKTTLSEFCISETTNVFDLSMASVYIKTKVTSTKRKQIKKLIDHIGWELADIIKQTKWMDTVTMQKALDKFDLISVMAVYPDGLLNDKLINRFYKDLILSPGHFKNVKEVFKFGNKKIYHSLRKPYDKSDWNNMRVSVLGQSASFAQQKNSIIIPLGLVYKWFFEEESPNYVNYGRLGFIVGHELSHAFDVNGAKINGFGNLDHWWENSTKWHYDNQTKCMVDQFNQYKYFSTVLNKTIPLQGKYSLNENIADDLGIMEAYQAYKKVEANSPSKTLPGLNLSPDQLFWVNFAMVWCTKTNLNIPGELTFQNGHAPAKIRVNNPLSNSKDFAKDFGCKSGSKMNPSRKRCQVWGGGDV